MNELKTYFLELQMIIFNNLLTLIQEIEKLEIDRVSEDPIV